MGIFNRRAPNRGAPAWPIVAVFLGVLLVGGWIEIQPDRTHTIAMTDCAPDSLDGRLSAYFFADDFWKQQRIDLAEEKHFLATWDTREAERRAQIDQRTEEILGKANASVENFYSEHPGFRPRAATTAAEHLRKRADEIERIDINELMRERRGQRLALLERCEEVLIYKHQDGIPPQAMVGPTLSGK